MKQVISLFLISSAVFSTGFASAPCRADDSNLTLERVVIVMRHGVRPPTKSAKSMADLSDTAWPDDNDWGAAPGELTPRGALAIRQLGTDLASIYQQVGLLPNADALANSLYIWADGADQRTRATAVSLAEGLAPSNPPATHFLSDASDPLFDGLVADQCTIDGALARKSVQDHLAIVRPEINSALDRLQKIMAPDACAGGSGACLNGPTKVTTTTRDIKLSGPLATAASVSESLLLEYENNLAMEKFGWGRATKEDLNVLMRLHEYTSDLTRRNQAIAVPRAAALAQAILSSLAQERAGSSLPEISDQHKLIILVGHDTNLANLAGVFNLSWQLPDQPDATAPGTALAFERWKNNSTGKSELKIRVFYRDLDQVRNLLTTLTRQATVTSVACSGVGGRCDLTDFSNMIIQKLPEACIQSGKK